MKISYLGNFKFPWCTEVHISKTLEALGHTVIRLQEDEADMKVVLDNANTSDMFLWTRTPGMLRFNGWEMISKIKVLKVSYHLDLYVGISRENWLDDEAFFHTDYVFQADGDPHSMEVFKQKNVNAIWQKPGVYAPECTIAEPAADLITDIAFIGSHERYHEEWPYRMQLVEWLGNTYKERFKAFPTPTSGVIMCERLNQLCASAKIIIGDALCKDFTHTNYWSNRVYEITGRGGFIIHPVIEGLKEEFGNNIGYYDYGNFGQLKSLIDYYISDNAAREELRKKGHELTKNNYTFTHRLQAMFEILEKEGAI